MNKLECQAIFPILVLTHDNDCSKSLFKSRTTVDKMLQLYKQFNYETDFCKFPGVKPNIIF